MTRGRFWGPLVLVLSLFLMVGCGNGDDPVPTTTTPPGDDTPAPPPPDPAPTAGSILALWESSGHADADAEAFTHWDEDGEISTACARCHSTPGYRDYLGDDGTAFGVVDNPAPLGTTVECDACHNDAALTLTEVTFPSGVTLTDLGAEARCMTCHQGRHSTVSMNDHINAAAVANDDAEDPDLSFQNIHYFAAGATLYGGKVMGAYQYTNAGVDGIIGTDDDEPRYGFYDRRNPHVASYDTCIECHNPHSLERNIVNGCDQCHTGVTSDADLRDIRMAGSIRDYDGDGNSIEGIYFEILTMREALYAAIQAYAASMGNPIVYDSHAYPYYFNDDGNGMVDPGEANYGNRYSHWTARLLRAAYNYQYAQKDTGAYAHNPKYVIEFLYDSLADLNAHPSVTVPNFAQMWRNDSGHFDAGAEAFRHWDEDEDPDGVILDGAVSENCVRCHSPEGFDFWAEYGLDLPRAARHGDGFRCEQCHVEDADYRNDPARKYIPQVEFPGGYVAVNPSTPGPNQDDTFLCISCHKGRLAGSDVNPMSPSFRNIHYLPAGATIWGSEAGVGAQYPTKAYSDRWLHAGEPPLNLSPTTAQCTFCHLEDHSFLPQANSLCEICHGAIPLEEYRINRGTDYDGDSDATEPLRDEVQTFGDRLWTAIEDYAAATPIDPMDPLGPKLGPIFYDDHAYPYFMKALPAGYGNRFTNWDYKLALAAFNYQYWKKEPGAWAHHTHYILQLLYDSIEDLGGDLTGLTRPAP